MNISSELKRDLLSSASSLDDLSRTREILARVSTEYPEIDLTLPMDIIGTLIGSKIKSAYYLFWCEDMNLEWLAEDGYMLYQNIDWEMLSCIFPSIDSHELNIESRRMIQYLQDNEISRVFTWDSESFSFEDKHHHHSCFITPIQDWKNWEIIQAWISVEVANTLR